MLDWVPDEAVRHRIFVDNPAEISGFDKVDMSKFQHFVLQEPHQT
jgi:hypothetical protein